MSDDLKEGDEVHAVRLGDGAYIVSDAFSKEIKRHATPHQDIGVSFGIKLIVSDTLPYIHHEPGSTNNKDKE